MLITNKHVGNFLLMIQNNDQKILNLLGLAMRANKLVLGTEPTLSAIKLQKVGVAFFPSDGGKSQGKKLADKSNTYGVTLIQNFSREQLVHAIGVNRSVFAIADRGFSRKIKALILEKERN